MNENITYDLEAQPVQGPETNKQGFTQIGVRGKTIQTPSFVFNDRTIIVTGKWVRIAVFQDEELIEDELVKDPQLFVAALKNHKNKADIFSFAQKIPETEPKYQFHFDWDNAAVVSTASFIDWWEKKIPQEARKNARRAAKRGVTVRVTGFGDEFVKGIKTIYDETPVRQGRRFWHFEKDFDKIKAENGTYPERSEFIGAYFQNELIGFIKLVYVNKVAVIIQILSKNAHYDKRPTNALIAKAVEVCHEKDISYLVYGKYSYGNNRNSQLAEFKRRNGFEQISFPRYFIPLTLKGKILLKLGLHRKVTEILPPGALGFLLSARSKVVHAICKLPGRRKPEAASENQNPSDDSGSRT